MSQDLKWYDIVIPILCAALAAATVFYHHKTQKTSEKIESPIFYGQRGPEALKEWNRVSHRIERLERRSMPESIGWKGFDRGVEEEYLKRRDSGK